jgi:hypothetical protein
MATSATEPTLRLGTKSSQDFRPDKGRLEIIPARELIVIHAIQRKPTPARVRKMANNWNDEMVDLLHVARITDGEYQGRLHITDGGTRWAAKKDFGDEDYPFVCWVREMSFVEAAQRFLWLNSESMRPNAFSRFTVGVRAGNSEALAIQRSLDALHLVGSPGSSTYGDPETHEPGEFAAFAAAERIVKKEHEATGDWDAASDLLTWSIALGRRAYPQIGDRATAIGHDADLVQSLATIATLNPGLRGDDQKESNLVHGLTTWQYESDKKTRLFEPGQLMKPEQWRVATFAATRNAGGSGSRGTQMARQIVLNHNQKLTPHLKPPAAPKR